MITTEPTQERLSEWKHLYDANISKLNPNRKSGFAVDEYFRNQYDCSILSNPSFELFIKENILSNDIYKEKLQLGREPLIRTYSVKDALVGIDLETGFFQVESENTELMIQIWDDLFLFRGLDAQDLQNFVLTGQYIQLLEQKSRFAPPEGYR